VAKKILLISDTHGSLPDQIQKYARDCDEIWHAGDVGNSTVIVTLQHLKPLRAVYGNIDGAEVKAIFPENLIVDCEGVKVLMTHIGGSPSKIPTRVKQLLIAHKPNIFICGHSHIARVETMLQFGNCTYINPGAEGNEGFQKVKTIMLIELDEGKIKSLKIVELGQRGTK